MPTFYVYDCVSHAASPVRNRLIYTRVIEDAIGTYVPEGNPRCLSKLSDMQSDVCTLTLTAYTFRERILRALLS
jgi:hypothetical protein